MTDSQRNHKHGHHHPISTAATSLAGSHMGWASLWKEFEVVEVGQRGHRCKVWLPLQLHMLQLLDGWASGNGGEEMVVSMLHIATINANRLPLAHAGEPVGGDWRQKPLFLPNCASTATGLPTWKVSELRAMAEGKKDCFLAIHCCFHSIGVIPIWNKHSCFLPSWEFDTASNLVPYTITEVCRVDGPPLNINQY